MSNHRDGGAAKPPSDPLGDTAVGTGGSAKPPFDPLADTRPAVVADTALSDTAVPNAALDATQDSSAAPGARVRRTRPDYPDLVPVNPEHYLLDKEIARGGMGRIRVARDLRLGRTVAVKEILVRAGDLARRFEREARITARLQHPSIVNVHEAGVWPSGEPFYSMKLVTGRSLDEVVADAKTLDHRLALLPNVLAIADAMAYAHGERVIHRDLKPKNVLVGAFGETVVIDWGLAKDLADRSSAPDLSSGPFRTSDQDAETAVGDVMGTPQYMPPEQAEGNPVDERADVYAIGALLDHVLSGKPAYTGANGVEILEAVKRGPPAPLAERQPGVPPDLLAIVNRAMARDPAARYPTARELAEDLRRYQTGQLVGAHRYSLRQLLRRWLRRHRAAVSVAIVATVVLLLLGGFALHRIIRAQHVAEEQRGLAEKQRALAEESRGESEKLSIFMLGDLFNKLQPLGRLDLLDAVAKQAAAHYERAGENLGEAELATRAYARRVLGDLKASQSDTKGAVIEYRAALAIDEARAVQKPGDFDREWNVSRGNQKLGDGLLLQGDTAGALEVFRKALAIRENLSVRVPENVVLQQDTASIQFEIGDVLAMRGDSQGSLQAYQQGHTITASIARKDPTNADKQRNSAITQTKMGDALFSQGDVAGAVREYRAGQLIRKALADADPQNADRQEYVAGSHGKVGAALNASGDRLGAITEFRAALAIHEALSANDPTNDSRRWSVAADRQQLGHMLKGGNDLAGAQSEYQKALAIDDALFAKDKSNADFALGASIDHVAIGDVLRAQGQLENALREYRDGIRIAEELSTKDPSNVDVQQHLASALDGQGRVLLAQGNGSAALVEFRKTLAIREALAAKDPVNVRAQTGPAYAHENIGEVLFQQRDFTGALASLRKGLAIRERVAAKDPTLQWELGMAYRRIGDVLLAQRDKVAATESFRSGLKIADALVATNPANVEWNELAKQIRAQVAK